MTVKVPEVMTVAEAAAYLRVDERTVRRLLREGRLPGRKVGREWRLHKAALDRFLAGEYEPLSPEALAAFRRGLEEIWAGRARPIEPDDDEDEPTAEELADAEAGWREYLEGKARPWDEIRKELTHDA
ncbi:MAG TPA: helix-turn-helix domain-containing protein [Thermaerobacter sp.]